METAAAQEGGMPRFMATPSIAQEFSADPPKAINVTDNDPEDGQYDAPGPGGVFSKYYQKRIFRVDQRIFVFVAGMLVLTFIIFPTVWSCNDLLLDDAYIYFFGRTTPNYLILGCCSVYAFFAVTVVAFFQCGRTEKQTEQSLWAVFILIFSFVGLIFMALGLPLHTEVDELEKDLFTRCQTSMQTRDLYEQYELLYMLRMTETCIDKESVELCSNYSATIQGLTLKSMEERFRCSGFCMIGTTASPTNASNVDDMSIAGDENTRTAVVYPPPLFSKENYKMSCDGATGRHMRNFVDWVAIQTFIQGLCFVALSVAVGFLQLFGLWVKTDLTTFVPVTARAERHYGSMSARTA